MCHLMKYHRRSSTLYAEGVEKINPLKKKDLLSMLHLIPPIHHHFYNTLPTAARPQEDDIDGFPEVLDFEMEQNQ